MDQDETARQRLDVARQRFDTASAELDRAREQLQAEVQAAAGAGLKQVEIVQRSGWTREYIRRLVAAKADR